MNLSALIYDIEILKAIPGKEPRIPGIEYCGGWGDHAGMGISCIGAYDYLESRHRIFMPDNLQEFVKLARARDLLVGFNSIPFDNRVVACVLDYKREEETSYDILREVWKASGLSENFQYQSHTGFGLDDCCKVNFGTQKTGNGALAPVLWQQGKFGEVVDYCLNDVKLTKQLFDAFVLEGQAMKSPTTGGTLYLSTIKGA